MWSESAQQLQQRDPTSRTNSQAPAPPSGDIDWDKIPGSILFTKAKPIDAHLHGLGSHGTWLIGLRLDPTTG